MIVQTLRITPKAFDSFLTLACNWAMQQGEYIIRHGVPLNDKQKTDASLMGIRKINKVRLLKVDRIPTPSVPELKSAAERTGLLSSGIIGLTLGYGICIKSDFWDQRRLLVHELTHTMQYERLRGLKPFLERYLNECITVGYLNGSLEQEAIRMEKEMCD
jgi:hypothetical protein